MLTLNLIYKTERICNLCVCEDDVQKCYLICTSNSSQSSHLYAEMTVSDRIPAHELSSSSGSQLLQPCKMTHQRTTIHPMTQGDGEEGYSLLAMSADEEIRGYPAAAVYHPSNGKTVD